MARHYSRARLRRRAPGPLPPAPAEQNGDIGAWLDYVRRVVRAFGPIRHVVRPADHQRGQHHLLAQHLRRRLRERRRGARPRRPGRQARGPPAGLRPARRPASTTPGASATPTPTSGARSAPPAASACAGPPTGSGSTPIRAPYVPRRASRTPATRCWRAIAQVRECYMPHGRLRRRGRRSTSRSSATRPGPGRSEAAQATALRAFVRDAEPLPRHLRRHQPELVRPPRQQQRRARTSSRSSACSATTTPRSRPSASTATVARYGARVPSR